MTTDQDKIRIAREYFVRLDQGRDLGDLVTKDFELYFPKLGFVSGPGAFAELGAGFAGQIEFIKHDYDRLTFLPSGEHLTVEGTSEGRMAGKSWSGGKTPGGRFCNVFRFREGRIASLHVYLDPDYTGEDAARFRWGQERRW